VPVSRIRRLPAAELPEMPVVGAQSRGGSTRITSKISSVLQPIAAYCSFWRGFPRRLAVGQPPSAVGPQDSRGRLSRNRRFAQLILPRFLSARTALSEGLSQCRVNDDERTPRHEKDLSRCAAGGQGSLREVLPTKCAEFRESSKQELQSADFSSATSCGNESCRIRDSSCPVH